ncbi:MAG: redoxin domain-containing protein [Chromatocurvus sp.]
MDWLVVSNIVLWIGFVAMVLLNLALVRQIGVLYERVAPAGALMLNQKVKVGMPAPSLSVKGLDGADQQIGSVASGKSQLLFFLSPDCPVCNELTPALRSAARAESAWMDVILVSDGDDQDHAGYVRKKQLDAFPYLVSEIVGKTYGVSKLPYAVLIDETGTIASMGIINSREHLDSLFEAKDLKVASIQDYMKKRGSPQQFDPATLEVDKA